MKRFIATTSLLLTFIVATAAAHAGSTITDKSYWPNEAKRSQAGAVRTSPSAAFASDVYAPAIPTAVVSRNAVRYQGGPKGR